MKNFYNYNHIAFDIETANGRGGGSLDITDGFIALMQIKLPDQEPILIDPMAKDGAEKVAYVKNILSNPANLIVGHNLKFDYKWLAYNGIFIANPFDTMIASQIYYAGLSRPDNATNVSNRNKKMFKDKQDLEPIFANMGQFLDFSVTKSSRFSHSFDACMLRELNIEISKDEQNSDWSKRPLTQEQVHYALWDVKKTVDLAKILYEKVASIGLEEVLWLEMDVEPAIAYKEMIGVGTDKEEWKTMTQILVEEVKNEKNKLENELGLRLAESDETRHGLFGIVPVNVNLNSPDMAKHLNIPDVQASTLKEYIDADPFVPKFIDFKLKNKLASTYGTTYLSKIGKDNRLRGDFSQAYTTTGRLSSKNPNLQNCPPNTIKSLLRPMENHSLVAIDFSTVELRILAYLSKDEKFIASCNGKDMHSENARLIFNIAEDQPVPKELRRKAKVVSFSIPYGTSAWGLFARGITETLEEAQELIDNFYDTFPQVADFLRKNSDSASQYGITRDAIGRVRKYDVPDPPFQYAEKRTIFKNVRPLLKENDWPARELFDMSYSSAAEEYGEKFVATFTKETFKICQEVNNYEKQIAAIRREGQNHPVQASSASITKQAMADAYKFLRDTGYGCLTLSIHDSIFYELNNDYFEYSFPEIIAIMENAGPKIVPDIITPVDADLGWIIKRKCDKHQEDVFLFNQKLEDNRAVFLSEDQINDYVGHVCDDEH